jgi:hypothetical protein
MNLSPSLHAAMAVCAVLWLGFTVFMHYCLRRDTNLAASVLLGVYYAVGVSLVLLAHRADVIR